MERDTIKKILKESDWDWTNTKEHQTEAPLSEVESWCLENESDIVDWIKKIKEFYENAPKMTWSSEEELYDKDKMMALSVKAIGDELRNILSSIDAIKGEMDYIRNPNKYDE